MTQVKTKFDTNTSISKIIQTFWHLKKLFRREVIGSSVFSGQTTTCGKYSCVCVMPELYFVFTRCSADANIYASTRKRKGFDLFACACAYFASEKQALTLKEQYIFL